MESSFAGSPAPPLLAVRDRHGDPWHFVSLDASVELLALGWCRWAGTGRRRHLKLTAKAPVSALEAALAGWLTRTGTRPMRSDGKLQRANARAGGQVLGERQSHLEHAKRVI